jgi:glucose-6-phosphate dehydrogenase assembly protein OpcA
MDADDRLAVFERGDAIEVPFDKIESELSALWRKAAESRPGAAPNAVTRACLWNLVLRVDGPEHFIFAKRLIDEVAQRIPTRTIVMAAEPGGADEVRAWVEANWRRPEGERASGSDEVTLLASGGAAARLPSLVRALLHPDAPTAMFWPAEFPELTREVQELIHEADRLIVDTRRLPSETELKQLCAIGAREPNLEIADLSWIGISPLRGLCASLFDPPRDPTVLERLDRVSATSNIEGTQARALLALGWLAARLGWSEMHRVPATGATEDGAQGQRHPRTRRWQARRRDGQNLVIELKTDLSGGKHGVAGLELQAGRDVWSLERQTCIDVSGPDMPPRSQPARSHSNAELVSAALGARGRDPMFREALAYAVRLVEA